MVVASLDKFKGFSTPSFFSSKPAALILVIGVVAIAIVTTLLWWLLSEPTPDGGDNLGSTTIEIPSIAGEDAISALADSITLSAEVMDTSWVTITMDGSRTQQLTLIPGAAHEWNASEKFVLSLSNAGGVRFFRDQYPLPLFGQRGQSVREITITRTDVISSASTLEQGAVSTKQPAQTNRPRPRSVRSTKRAPRPQMPIITPAPSRDPIRRPSNTND